MAYYRTLQLLYGILLIAGVMSRAADTSQERRASQEKIEQPNMDDNISSVREWRQTKQEKILGMS